MSTAVIRRDVIETIIGEMALGVDRAVECWMSQIDEILSDPRLTSLGRLQAVRQVLERYKQVTGKQKLQRRVE